MISKFKYCWVMEKTCRSQTIIKHLRPLIDMIISLDRVEGNLLISDNNNDVNFFSFSDNPEIYNALIVVDKDEIILSYDQSDEENYVMSTQLFFLTSKNIHYFT